MFRDLKAQWWCVPESLSRCDEARPSGIISMLTTPRSSAPVLGDSSQPYRCQATPLRCCHTCMCHITPASTGCAFRRLVVEGVLSQARPHARHSSSVRCGMHLLLRIVSSRFPRSVIKQMFDRSLADHADHTQCRSLNGQRHRRWRRMRRRCAP